MLVHGHAATDRRSADDHGAAIDWVERDGNDGGNDDDGNDDDGWDNVRHHAADADADADGRVGIGPDVRGAACIDRHRRAAGCPR